MPEYSPLRDKHTATYKKTLLNSMSTGHKVSDVEAALNKKAKQKTYFEKKLDLLGRIKEKHTYVFNNAEMITSKLSLTRRA